MINVNLRWNTHNMTQKLFLLGFASMVLLMSTMLFVQSVHAATPTGFTSQVYQDSNGDGTVDQVVVTINGGEALTTCTVTDAEVASDWTYVGNDVGGSLAAAGNSHTCILGTATITLQISGANSNVTGHTSAPTLAYNNTDGDNSVANASGILGSVSAQSITDNAGPVLIEAHTYDIGADGSTANGKVDHLQLRFTEALNDSAINNYSAASDYTPASFAIANVVGEAIDATEGICPNDTAEGDEYLCVIFTEDTNQCARLNQTGCDTGAVDQDITLTGASATLQDAAGNNSPDILAGTVVEADRALPYPVAADYFDTIGQPDGRIDQTRILFSEIVNYNTYQDSDWSVTTNDITGYDVTGCNTCTGLTQLTLTTTAPAGVTGAATNPTLSYAAGNAITDNAGNNALNFSNITIEDFAAPVFLSAEYKDLNTDGQIDAIDTTWSADTGLACTYEAADWTIVAPGEINVTAHSGCSVPSSNIVRLSVLLMQIKQEEHHFLYYHLIRQAVLRQ